MKKVIYNPFTPIPVSEKSHIRGNSLIWSNLLNCNIADKHEKLNNSEVIYFEHGVNFSGTLNLFSGADDELVDRCYNLIEAVSYGAKLYSLDLPMKKCDYVNQLRKRIGKESSSDSLNEDLLKQLEETLRKAKTLTMKDLNLEKQILGDSHCLAYSEKNQIISRFNGKTLNNVLNYDLEKFILENVDINKIKEITLCYGSIDIRFHVLKNKISPKDFCKNYTDQIIKFQNKYKIPLKICTPVPIEHEERKIPKTGQYKGVNFNGSRQERLDFTLSYIKYLEDFMCEFEIVSPPKEWYEMDGKEYAREIMELNSSVHISPKYYKSIYKW